MNSVARVGVAVLSALLATGANRETQPNGRIVAAPRVIVLGGGPLRHRVVLADFDENLRLMLAATEIVRVRADSLAKRPRIRLVMYWGDQWSGQSDLPDSIGTIPFRDGAQPGAFYPAWRGQPPLWEFGAFNKVSASMRWLSGEGIAILAKRGVLVAIH
jgi:hypothetical protein